jgi:hypothetical protein
MKSNVTVAAVLLAALALPAVGQQTQADAFKWSNRVAPGNWVRVYNLNGRITVGAASGDNVEVVATKQWRRGDPAVVRFSADMYGQDAVICALWGSNSTCGERGMRTRGDRDDRGTRSSDVRVEFKVLVPKGVKVAVETVNGGVIVDGVTSDVRAETVNGTVDVATTGGRVNASNVNGDVRARLGRVDSDEDMKFETVNGNVIVEFTGDFGGDIDLETVNGSLNTNFELTVSGRLDPKHLRAHIGKPGGPRLKLETVNGSVELRKR